MCKNLMSASNQFLHKVWIWLPCRRRWHLQTLANTMSHHPTMGRTSVHEHNTKTLRPWVEIDGRRDVTWLQQFYSPVLLQVVVWKENSESWLCPSLALCSAMNIESTTNERWQFRWHQPKINPNYQVSCQSVICHYFIRN